MFSHRIKTIALGGISTLLMICTICHFIYRSGTIIEKNSFSLENDQNVNKILLYKKHLPSGGFIKNADGEWQLNSTDKVDRQMSQLLLKVLKTISIQGPVEKSKRQSVVKSLKEQGLVIEYYHKNYLTKAFFISSVSPGSSYSYAMLEGDDTPYLIFIPEVKYDLAGLLAIPEVNWKDNTLFSSEVDEIINLRVDYANNPKDSFEITRQQDGFNLSGIPCAEKRKILDYLTNFQHLTGRGRLSKNELLIDSVKISNPFCTIALENKNAIKGKRLAFFKSPNPDLLYCQGENKLEVYIIPAKAVNHLFAKREDLISI